VKKNIIILFVVLVAIIGVAVFLQNRTNTPGKLDSFAQCLTDKKATFYGAFWCPHCREQKQMFGSSAKLLPYVECSTPDGQNQTAQCKEKNIMSYPTWMFANGEVKTGTIELAELASTTGCVLPTTP
jgi:thiol-disulfide isomerase/thioredoxin